MMTKTLYPTYMYHGYYTHSSGEVEDMDRISVSLQDVAKEAGVSSQTVSRVANGSAAVRPGTRRKVEVAMERLGYRPNYAARALKSGKFNNVGVLLSHMSAYGNARTLEGIVSAAADNGYSTTIRTLDNLQDRSLSGALKLVEQLPLDGAVVIMERDFTDFNQFKPSCLFPKNRQITVPPSIPTPTDAPLRLSIIFYRRGTKLYTTSQAHPLRARHKAVSEDGVMPWPKSVFPSPLCMLVIGKPIADIRRVWHSHTSMTALQSTQPTIKWLMVPCSD